MIAPSVRTVLSQASETAARVEGLRTIGAIDSGCIAPMMGCDDRREYYAAASAFRELGRVRRPLLLLSAENDPLRPKGMLEELAVAAREGGAPLVLALTAEGGHSLTWPEGWRAESAWASDVVVEWVEACAAHVRHACGVGLHAASS